MGAAGSRPRRYWEHLFAHGSQPVLAGTLPAVVNPGCGWQGREVPRELGTRGLFRLGLYLGGAVGARHPRALGWMLR